MENRRLHHLPPALTTCRNALLGETQASKEKGIAGQDERTDGLV
jgi:hypothetical protein